jgi:malectin (di-glucose binding ER protein)
MRMRLFLRSAQLLWAVLLFGHGGASGAPAEQTSILLPREASSAESFAAREVRRYVYLRTDTLLTIQRAQTLPPRGSFIVVGRCDQPLMGEAVKEVAGSAALITLGPQEYWLKSAVDKRRQCLLVAGGDDAGTLYGAYRLAEHLGVRFYLHGDVIPEERASWQLPRLDERGAPFFALRGIQPFHDFAEGPDWWNREEYLAIVAQLPKLRMNFFGLHTYPEGRPNAEPTVWIGLPQDVGEGGRVKFSYPSSYQNTARGNWGYAPAKTSDYAAGSADLFDRDDFGPEVMHGCTPAPTNAAASDELFEGTAAVLRDAFTLAHQVGVKTCVGTETPLVLPKRIQERLQELGKDPAATRVRQELYEGIFRRAARAYPLDYYWFWTPEDWTWSGVKEDQIRATTDDMFAAIAAHEQVKPPFALATCGWVLGPQSDRALFDKVLPKNIAISCINREVGYSPVEPGFAEVQGRSKWAIPWLEDDPALTSPQLWVGRMRRDAFDARRYGCDGLMGIHWRTRALGPNVSALAQAAWDQRPWAANYHPVAPAVAGPSRAGPVGGQIAAFPNHAIADTSEGTLYQTVRYNLSGYHLPASNGPCRVTLKFCEPFYDAPSKRVFDVKLQGHAVLTNLDIFARVGKDRALDYSFNDVAVTNGWLDLEFVPRVEFPSIAALVIDGKNFQHKINCGGPACAGYTADVPEAPVPKPILPGTFDFYRDWALHQFGPEACAEAATIFEKLDGALPHPCNWVDGPGGIQPDPRPWTEVEKEYAFAAKFEALQPLIRGAGNQERFDYWRHTLLYLRTVGEIDCVWAEYNRIVAKIKAEIDSAAQKDLVRRLALPVRRQLAGLVHSVFEHLLATVSTPGELGTVANWNQHILPNLLTKPGEELTRILGDSLPPEAEPCRTYHGPTRVFVPMPRTSLAPSEPLKLRVVILSEVPPREAALYWRPLGGGAFAKVELEHRARGVYSVEVDKCAGSDLEYYVRLESAHGKAAFFPATAPRLNQTVVRCGEQTLD